MQFQKRKDHLEAEKRYSEYREIVYEATMEEFPGIQARAINFSDALEADSWKSIPRSEGRGHRAGWDWALEYPSYKKKPNRFEISLSNGKLCALCLGKASMHGTKVRMNLIESIPIQPSPLGAKAMPILSFAATVYADIIGADELWVMDPFPNLESYYQANGFSGRKIYHGKRVGQRKEL